MEYRLERSVEDGMPWNKMRIPGGSQDLLPGERGRYLLWLEPPILEDGRYVHFSWVGTSYCVRDYLGERETRNHDGLSVVDFWNVAKDRIPCKGELYVPVENFEFWSRKLRELSERRRAGHISLGWAPLSSKHVSRPESFQLPPAAVTDDSGRDFYRKFIILWRAAGFDIIERTVGCSARFEGEPILWVYPKYFQVAPRGKGNTRHDQIRLLMDQHFPESHTGSIPFESEFFTWDRFENFVTQLKGVLTSGL